MNPFGLPENKYANVTCWDEKYGVQLPDGFVISKLSKTQLKKLEIPTVKGFFGFEYVRMGGRRGFNRPMPKLANLIRIEDEPRALHYEKQLEMTKKYKLTRTDELNWLFE